MVLTIVDHSALGEIALNVCTSRFRLTGAGRKPSRSETQLSHMCNPSSASGRNWSLRE